MLESEVEKVEMSSSGKVEMSSSGKVEMPSSGDSDTDEWLKMEARFRDEGQAYGLKGLDLLKYVQDLLAQAKERRQRFEEREERVRQQEAEEIRLRRQHELEMYKVREEIYPKSVRSEGDTVERKNVGSLKLEVPKFDKQEVATYFEFFEGIMERNGVPQKDWPLFMRSAVVGTKLAPLVDDFCVYKDLKQEALLAFGATPSTVWKELHAARQSGTETFRQFALRVTRLMARRGKLALELDSASVDEVMEAIMRQLVLEAVEPDVRAYLLRRKKEDKSFAEFVEAGSAYQEAYGRKPVKAQVLKMEKQAEPVGTAQCLKIATNDHERVLASMTMDERQVYMTKHSLCFNCLRNGH